jgi:hypothetical protein
VALRYYLRHLVLLFRDGHTSANERDLLQLKDCEACHR